jgi:hypothetical protein
VGIFTSLCEDIRNAVDDQGAKGCFQKSVLRYSKKTGIPTPPLWVVVNSVIRGDRPEKVLKVLQKKWGGSPQQWMRWWSIVRTRPDCPGGR